MEINSKELEEYVANVLTAVATSAKKSPEEFELNSDVKFELTLVNTKKGKAGINIGIAKAGGDLEKKTLTRISFSMGSKNQQERAISAVTKFFEILKDIDKPKSFVGRKLKSK